MAGDAATLLGGLAGLAGATAVTTIGIAAARRTGPYLPAGHALADPADLDPLPEVLRLGLAGLTVPVRPGPRGELFLGPGVPRPGQTLRRLVLTPLFARAGARGGRLRPDQRVPFRLVVEFTGQLRDADLLLRAFRLLDQQLRDHGQLVSRCLDGRLEPGAVTVSVAGIVDVRNLLAAQPHRYAFADGTFADLGSFSAPPELAPMISEPWSRRFGWDGRDPMPAEERHLLHGLVRAAHEDGRTVRVSAPPVAGKAARRAVWSELVAAGVDVIADADQAGLARFLRRREGVRPVSVAPTPEPAV